MNSLKKFFALLFGKVVWDDSKFLYDMWKPCENDAKKELGTKRACIETLSEVLSLLHAKNCHISPLLGFDEHCCENERVHDSLLIIDENIDSDFMADALFDRLSHERDVVSAIHQVGYLVYRSNDGILKKEVIGVFGGRVEILRKNNQIFAVTPFEVLSSERCAGDR